MSDANPPSHKSHDRFFKLIFSEKVRAIGFLKGALPARLSRLIDFDTLSLESGEYPGGGIAPAYSDLIFKGNMHETAGGEPFRIAFLLEHKSYAPRQPYLQLLRYMLGFLGTGSQR